MPMTCRDRESGTNKGSASEFISSAPSPFCEIVAAHAAEGDALCRISPVILDAMRSEGLFRTLQPRRFGRSEEHTSELQSLMRISYAVFCLKKKKKRTKNTTTMNRRTHDRVDISIL